jgi:hypothetical protein
MSLTVDGVWKAGVWAPTVWASGVWFEPAAASTASRTAGGMAYKRSSRDMALVHAWVLRNAPKKKAKKPSVTPIQTISADLDDEDDILFL